MEFNDVKAEAICNDLYSRGLSFEQVEYLGNNLSDQDFDETYDFSELEKAYQDGDFSNGYTPNIAGLGIKTDPTPVLATGIGTGLIAGISSGLALNHKGVHHPVIGGAAIGATAGITAGLLTQQAQKNKAAQQLGYTSYKDLKAARDEAQRAGNFAIETPGLQANLHPNTVNAIGVVGTLASGLTMPKLTKKLIILKDPATRGFANTVGSIGIGAGAKLIARQIDNNQAAKKLGFDNYADYNKVNKERITKPESKQALLRKTDFSVKQILNKDYAGDFSVKSILDKSY